jgi:hypothetical protein
MVFKKIDFDDIETFTVVTNPVRSYVSASGYGVTGSVPVYARRSVSERDMNVSSAFLDAKYSATDVNETLQQVKETAKVIRNAASGSGMVYDIHDAMQQYMDAVHAQARPSGSLKEMGIIRFTPSFRYTDNTARKLLVKDILDEYYTTMYPTVGWTYTNYNTLNFFTSANVPAQSTLLYPNIEGGPNHTGYVSGTYSLSGAFSFDFYINPRYQQHQEQGDFKAGTLFHLSSTYAVSLITGSHKDARGRASSFRIQLQLSHSADIAPSLAQNGAYPNDLIFTSDDNSLDLNKWHHVVIRWGTNLVNYGTGTFNIDGEDKGTFCVPSGTITPRLYDSPQGNPSVLVVGNYYEGENSGIDAMALFFATSPALRDGLNKLVEDGGVGSGGVNEPTTYAFTHPLNAEVHDISIKRYYMADEDIAVSSSRGPARLDSSAVAFYVPPFFVQESPFRRFEGAYGGVPQTPFFPVDGTTDDPFNVAMSFGVGGHYINLENFVRDFASDNFPRLHHLTATLIDYTTQARPANEFLYDDPFVRKRNLTVLPCDDGNFIPTYELLMSESRATKLTNRFGYPDYSLINLDNMIYMSSMLFGTSFAGVEADGRTDDQAEELENELIGFTPENPGNQPGNAFAKYVETVDDQVASGTYDPGIQGDAPLTIAQRTRDPSSNQVTFFDVSNLLYGQRILPQSFEIVDPLMSGSDGNVGDGVSITLKDNGFGNLYRADALTDHARWASVGNIYYDEGLVAIKSPHLYFFGERQYEANFRGEQNFHVLKVDVVAGRNQLNSSSNVNFQPVSASAIPNDPQQDFVYITGIYFHDDNYNVIAKAQLAQPIMKRWGDRILFKTKFDF